MLSAFLIRGFKKRIANYLIIRSLSERLFLNVSKMTLKNLPVLWRTFLLI